MRGIIVALGQDRVIGVGNTLPWRYPADLKRFRRVTLGTTVIMGRRTWESLPKRPLEGRRNVVITARHLAGVECYASLAAALASVSGDVWVIGGAQLFAAALPLVDVLDVTYVPDAVADPTAVYFPPIDPALWTGGPRTPLDGDGRLLHQEFRRR